MADLKENELPKQTNCEWVRALDANGNSIQINKKDLASVLGELIGINNTWFRKRTDITIPNWDDISNLDNATESGVYVIRLESASIWGVMTVFSGNSLQGCSFQILLYNGKELKFRRRGNNMWTDWRTFSFT